MGGGGGGGRGELAVACREALSDLLYLQSSPASHDHARQKLWTVPDYIGTSEFVKSQSVQHSRPLQSAHVMLPKWPGPIGLASPGCGTKGCDIKGMRLTTCNVLESAVWSRRSTLTRALTYSPRDPAFDATWPLSYARITASGSLRTFKLCRCRTCTNAGLVMDPKHNFEYYQSQLSSACFCPRASQICLLQACMSCDCCNARDDTSRVVRPART